MRNLVTIISCVFIFTTACGSTGSYGLNEDSGVNDNVDNSNNTNPSACGDGVVDPGEVCDDGSANSDSVPDACRTDCRASYCGDSVIDSDEACDSNRLNEEDCVSLGYTKGVLSCADDCTFAVEACSSCGNDNAEGDDPTSEGYETCDGSDLRDQTCISIGQAQGVLTCDSSCGWDISGCVGGGAVCGNGVVETGEDCDDGNNDVTDGCPDGPQGTCLFAACGDGFIQAGVEGCDDGNGMNGDLCPDGIGGTCQTASCGDGHVFIGVELCDTASDPLCYVGCNTRCGDGILHENPEGEICDDGNNVDGDACYSDCTGFCGDAVVHDGVNYPDHGEICDDGHNTATCDSDCTLPICGDGHCNTAVENMTSCSQDCDCVDMGGVTYSGGCCLPENGVGVPPQACEGAHPGCVIWTSLTEVYNCGACGIHCPVGTGCYGGSCVGPG